MSTALTHPAVSNDVEAVYREDGDRLWRSVFSFAGDPDVASDAVGTAFADALRHGAAIRDPRGWVWRTAFRLAGREMKRRRSLVFGGVPERVHRDPEADAELLAALQQLTDGQRACVVLHYYADLPVAEISRRTGINPLAVRAHLSRGRKRLRALLGDHRD